MATFDSLSGVNRLSDNRYEVTSNVLVGSNIDDVQDAVIVIKSGRLRFGNGCTTTFTRCFIIETSNTQAFGADNFNGSNQCRIKGDITCSPIFQGVHWIVEDDNVFGRSDFDIGGTAKPTFKRSDDGKPCRITTLGNVAQFNHFASPNIIIDGLVINDKRNGGDMEFRVPPPNVNDFTILDNNNGSNDRHFVALMNQWSDNSIYEIKKLSARNVACWQGNSTKILRLIDPVGDIRKATDTGDSQAGVLEIWRSYSVRALDINSNQFIVCETIISKGNEIVNRQITDDYKKTLFQEKQQAGSVSIQTDNNYRRSLCAYGYEYDVRTISVGWDSELPDGIAETIILKKDNYLTTPQIDVYNIAQCTSLHQIYEKTKYFEMFREDRQFSGEKLVEAKGDTLSFVKKITLITGINNTAQLPILGVIVSESDQIKIYTTATLNESIFKALDATVNIKSQADADKLKGLRIVGNGKLAVNMPANSTLELDNITFDSPLHIESTNALTVVNKNGSNASVGSANVTIVALVNIQGYGIVSGSRVLIQYADGAKETIFNDIATSSNITIEQQYATDRPIAVAVRKATGTPAYIPWATTGTLTESGFSFTANQVSDE